MEPGDLAVCFCPHEMKDDQSMYSVASDVAHWELNAMLYETYGKQFYCTTNFHHWTTDGQ